MKALGLSRTEVRQQAGKQQGQAVIPKQKAYSRSNQEFALELVRFAGDQVRREKSEVPESQFPLHVDRRLLISDQVVTVFEDP